MALLPDKHRFVAWRGATFSTTLTLYTDEGVSLRNLTGYTAALTVKDAPGGATLLSLTTANGGITLGGAAGTIALLITDEQTLAQAWVGGVYELSITSGSGDTDVLLHGPFVIRNS